MQVIDFNGVADNLKIETSNGTVEFHVEPAEACVWFTPSEGEESAALTTPETVKAIGHMLLDFAAYMEQHEGEGGDGHAE